MPTGYTKQDAAKDTGSSVKDVSAAQHAARTDAGARSTGANQGKMEPASDHVDFVKEATKK